MHSIVPISKATFLRERVVPASDDDAFNHNKCAYCWDTYDNHPAVRILPCNHVFGYDCFFRHVDDPHGDLCIICRTPLFYLTLDDILRDIQRSIEAAVDRFIITILVGLLCRAVYSCIMQSYALIWITTSFYPASQRLRWLW
ncbi:hypothetical protein CC80DRAFT_565088 [Byssothecium circinans]|uniref:RING-type domain-containing protein n=1 Tax=Byssothecium circinans TaxID=147558 RepID=A0A6A5UNG8_9PLEO|nr:hypothetical protein CC80DRAFT_565088 [Byssothecium circinans]